MEVHDGLWHLSMLVRARCGQPSPNPGSEAAFTIYSTAASVLELARRKADRAYIRSHLPATRRPAMDWWAWLIVVAVLTGAVASLVWWAMKKPLGSRRE
jgi:hypothetical protein